jgi:hypothetical protein
MPVSDVKFSDNDDPKSRAQSVLEMLGRAELEARFVEVKTEKPTIRRDYLETVIDDLAQASQNQSVFNKFLQIDTALTKELRKYKSDIKNLLSSMLGSSDSGGAIKDVTESEPSGLDAVVPDLSSNKLPEPNGV